MDINRSILLLFAGLQLPWSFFLLPQRAALEKRWERSQSLLPQKGLDHVLESGPMKQK